jgi:diguanylate cyclase (GGDEF)-like protein/PAS domain S-box-containing protein
MEHLPGSPIARFADLLLDAICLVDTEGRFKFVSTACERIFGYTKAELVGMKALDMVAPHDRARTEAAAASIMDGQRLTHFQNQYVRKDGTLVDLMWSARWSEEDQLRVAVGREITVLKRAEAMQAALYAISEAAHATDDLPALFARSQEIIGALLPIASFSVALQEADASDLQYDRHATPTHDCAAHTQLVMLLCQEVQRSAAPLLLAAPATAGMGPALRAAVAAMDGSALAVPLTAGERTIGVLVLRSFGSEGYTDGDLHLLTFVSTQLAAAIARKQLHAQMLFMAMHDELTHLPNRRLFYDRLDTALARAGRQRLQFALLFIDLDRFKQVNDQHGHACGDRLLQETARRIRGCLRESDTLARIGGDEFVVLLERIVSATDAAGVAGKIHQALAAAVEAGPGLHLSTTVSVGLAVYPDHGADAKSLMAHADRAMYARKAQAAGVLPQSA